MPVVKTYHDYIKQYFAPADWPTAEAIVIAESGGRVNATCYNTNGTIDRGVFQINSIHAGMVNGDLNALFDPETNVRVAARLHASQGWRPWVTYNSGAYRRFL